MKGSLIGGVLGLSVLAAVATGGDFLQVPNPKPGTWHDNYRDARELARKSGKPLFVVFC
jgi:hypothetical protein